MTTESPRKHHRHDVFSSTKREHLVALNFKVPLLFRKALKMEAAARGITMTDLLYEAVRLLNTRSSAGSSPDEWRQ